MQATKVSVDKLSDNNLLVVLLLVSFIIIGTTALAAKSLITGLIRDTKVLSAENKANSALDKNISAAPDLITSFQALGPTANVLADALPNDANFPGLIVALENIANDSNIVLKSVTPNQVFGSVSTGAADGSVTAQTADSIMPPKPQPYAFTATFDGSYVALQKLMSDLERYDRPMRVTSIRLSGSGSTMSGTIDMQTFYQDKAVLPLAKETIK